MKDSLGPTPKQHKPTINICSDKKDKTHSKYKVIHILEKGQQLAQKRALR